MVASSFEIDDRFGNRRLFSDLQDFKEFFETEKVAWSWLSAANHELGNAAAILENGWNQIAGLLNQYEQGQIDIARLKDNLNRIYSETHLSAMFSCYYPGIACKQIADATGASDGERAVLLLANHRNLNVSDLKDFQVWQMLSSPSIIPGEGVEAEQRERLTRARDRFLRQSRRFGKTIEESERKTDELLADLERKFAERSRAVTRRSLARALRFREKSNFEILDFERQKASYLEEMKLKAPAEYWRGKMDAHADGYKFWGVALAVYAVVSVIILCLVYWGAWSLIATEKSMSGHHLLLIAGLGTLLTVMLWAGRIGVRIFLGERHLHSDAEERHVMTQAYLALIKEGGASEIERSIILSALFRAAQDGIVKDDSTVEASLPAVMARLLDAKART